MKCIKPKRLKNSHKGQNGRVLIVGGSEDYTGAVTLAGLAAMRSGCDIVTIAAPEKVAWAINAQSPDLITKKMPGKILTEKHAKAILALSAKHDVLLFGNGMGIDPATKRLCKRLAGLPMPKVIDADGIKALSASDVQNAILTPNKPELKIFLQNSQLTPTEDPVKLQRQLKPCFARGNILLLKGPTDIIIDAQIKKISGGNPGLTKGGTGDVLAGLCAGYTAQMKNPLQAAVNASVVQKHIADLLLKKHRGYTYLASDLLQDIQKL